MESILTSLKKVLGIMEEDDSFDYDIIMHANAVFMTLNQIGIGPEEGFSITSDEQTWTDFLGDSKKLLGAVQSYMYLKVRMLFDPPTSHVLEAMNRQATEYEWRLSIQNGTGVLDGTT